MDETFVQDNMTKASTNGVLGMYGTDDVYYFWLNFIPAQDIISTSTYFYFWVQMGDASSDWEGVTYSNTASTMSASVDCEPLSATNSVYASADSSNYDDDSSFNGIVIYDATNP